MVPKSVTEFFKLDEEAFRKTGALNALLDLDTRVFIDPHLLAAAQTPELKNSYQTFRNHFDELLRVLEKSTKVDDAFWREAKRRLTFPEVQGLCIGYGSDGTDGSGMGAGLREQLLTTAKEIIDVGIRDPEIFELVGLIEDGIGADRVSDMTARIIAPHLYDFTARAAKDLGIPTKGVDLNGKTYALPENSFNRKPLILVPEEILRPLPIAYSWSDIDSVCATNNALRGRVNRDIGSTWKYATTRVDKARLRAVVLRNPGVLEDLVAQYKKKPAEKYNFRADPEGAIRWYEEALKLVKAEELKLAIPAEPKLEDVVQVVRAICQRFKFFIEDRGLSKMLYKSKGKPHHESHAQMLFYAIADGYCEKNDLGITPEADAGRGPVDFKFNKGYKIRVIAEVKLSSNSQLAHGYTTQVGEYEKAEKAGHAFFIVVDVAKGGNWPEKLATAEDEAKKAKKSLPEIYEIDGRPKASASKYKET